MSWNERGVDLLVTSDGNVHFSVLNRVVEKLGCEKNINCPQLVELMESELSIQKQCSSGHSEVKVMPVYGYVSLMTACKEGGDNAL